jgi:predicted transcriptional regulator
MKTKEKSLQKLTDKEIRVQALLKQERITLEDIREQFPKEERTDVLRLLLKTSSELQGEEHDQFYQKIEDIVPPEGKNRLWEYNHNQITWAIAILMQEGGRMPTGYEIAKKAGLSRQTVHKHLKEYTKDERYLEKAEQFRFMSSKVLARVYTFAVNGDMRAARLYFDVVGNLGKPPSGPSAVTNTQNNYIQVNQIRLIQQTIEQLSEEQLNQIEAMLNTIVKNSNTQS